MNQCPFYREKDCNFHRHDGGAVDEIKRCRPGLWYLGACQQEAERVKAEQAEKEEKRYSRDVTIAFYPNERCHTPDRRGPQPIKCRRYNNERRSSRGRREGD